jgi:hypothetical protein
MTRARSLASNRRDVPARVSKVANKANMLAATGVASRARRETSETGKTMKSSALVAQDKEARIAAVRIAAARIVN